MTFRLLLAALIAVGVSPSLSAKEFAAAESIHDGPVDIVDVEVQNSLPGRAPLATPRSVLPDQAGNYRIDLLVLFTSTAESKLGGRDRLASSVNGWINSATGYMENSNVPIVFRVTGLFAYPSASDSGSTMVNNLRMIRDDPEVKRLRDDVGADLVILIQALDSSGFCGVSSTFNGAFKTDPPTNVDPESDAFMVAGMAPGDFGISCPKQVIAHEIGHALGAGHEFQGELSGPSWKTYSHAWECGGASKRKSMMWSHTDSIKFSTLFSNPDISIGGEPCGARGLPVTEREQADNARAMTLAAQYVAAYRDEVVPEEGSNPPQSRNSGSFGGGVFGSFAGLLGAIVIRRRSKLATNA